MPKVKFGYDIGFCGCTREEIIDIDDDEWAKCETEEEKDDLLNDYLQNWISSFADGWWDISDEVEYE